MTYEYPLSWPVGVPRAARSLRSKFNTPETRAKQNLESELRLLGAVNAVVTTNVELRRDGRPYVNQRMSDAGVAVYFRRKGTEQCIACDKWDSVRDNVQAIAKTVEALRGIERWGTGEMVDAAFRGFTALPANANGPVDQPWYDVLEVAPTAAPEVVKAAYKAKLIKAHPDTGGSEAELASVQQAYREARS